jgi:hypothetical protein
MVYSLMNTLRCKRCKGIWKVGDEYLCSEVTGIAANPPAGTKTRSKPLAKRLEAKLEECLARSGGRFCPDTLNWQAGEISREMFRNYLRRCVREGTLAEERDRFRRTWYRRPR